MYWAAQQNKKKEQFGLLLDIIITWWVSILGERVRFHRGETIVDYHKRPYAKTRHD